MNAADTSPALSVVLPVYNGAHYVAGAIESILAQTFHHFELIIIDDGSTDGSGAIIDRLAARDGRIRVVRQENQGLVAALNRGIGLARADLIARMDADDLALPGRFELQMRCFDGRPELAVVGGFVNIVDQQGRHIRLADYPLGGAELAEFIEHGCPVAHPSVILRRRAVLDVGGYRPAFRHGEDYDLWLRMFDAGHLIENVPKPVLDYRQHDDKISFRFREQQEITTLVAQLSHRARRAGLADPVASLASIDRGTIELFPPGLRGDLDTEFFVLRHYAISLAEAAAIDTAMAEFRRLSVGAKKLVPVTYFLLRAARGYLNCGRYGAALGCFVDALSGNPALAARLVLRKIQHLRPRLT